MHTHTNELTHPPHFYVQPGFIIISLIEWLAAGCLCSYISMHYGSDETPFTWREQHHRAKQVRQSLDVSQPGNNKGGGAALRRRWPAKRVLKLLLVNRSRLGFKVIQCFHYKLEINWSPRQKEIWGRWGFFFDRKIFEHVIKILNIRNISSKKQFLVSS